MPAFHALPRLDEAAQHGIDTGLVASAVSLEPVEDVCVKANVNVLLRRGQPDGDRAFPICGQGTFVPVGEPFNLRPRHRIGALPIGLAFATRNFSPDLVSRKSRDIFVLPHLLLS